MTAPTIPTALNHAADLIEQRGLAFGVIGMHADGNGPLCMEGAIQAAVGAPTFESGGRRHYEYLKAIRCPAGDAVREYLSLNTELWRWNDAPGRTADEVVAVLRACALVEAAKEARCRACRGDGRRLHGWAICPGPCETCGGSGTAAQPETHAERAGVGS